MSNPAVPLASRRRENIMLTIAILWFLLVILVTVWASRWGRSTLFYFLVSLFISPIIGGVILLISGKKERRRALESEKTS
jgi:hypothetical protein